MAKFTRITPEVLRANEKFATYLRQADIKPARSGGTFVGNYEKAPDDFRKYGIILPKGGMIVPDAEPDILREILYEPERRREAEDVQTRRTAEAAYLDQVKEMVASSGIPDIVIEVKDGKDIMSSCLWHKSFLTRGGETVFSLHSEDEPYRGLSDDKSYKPWAVRFTPLEKIETFLEKEARLVEPRKMLGERINHLINELPHKGRAELRLYNTDSSTKNVLSAHRIWYRDKLYQVTEEDVAQLENEIGNRAVQASARQEILKKLFIEAKGVFTVTSKERCEFAGHSFLTGKARYDEWLEYHYFIGQEEVTEEECRWLNTFLHEVPVPRGHVRISNITNDLIKVPEMPGSHDVLIVIGKTGSRHGEKTYGQLFRGHPSRYTGSLYDKGIREVHLNGKPLTDFRSFDPKNWTNPKWLARKALGESAPQAHIDALAQIYKERMTP